MVWRGTHEENQLPGSPRRMSFKLMCVCWLLSPAVKAGADMEVFTWKDSVVG